MKITRIILAILVVSLSSYSLITDEYGTMPYVQMLLGMMLLVWVVNEFQENRNAIAILLLLPAGFSLFVGIYILLN